MPWQHSVNHGCNLRFFSQPQTGNKICKGIRYPDICQRCNWRTNGILAQNEVVDKFRVTAAQLTSLDCVESRSCLRHHVARSGPIG